MWKHTTAKNVNATTIKILKHILTYHLLSTKKKKKTLPYSELSNV